MIETATFVCSICGELSTDICVYCTKDACRNHRCQRCKRCSDCCECEFPLSDPEIEGAPPPHDSLEPPAPEPALSEPPVASAQHEPHENQSHEPPSGHTPDDPDPTAAS